MINFSYQYLPEAKVHLKLSQISTTELFRENFFSKIYKKTQVPESFLNKVTGLYSAASLRESTPT